MVERIFDPCKRFCKPVRWAIGVVVCFLTQLEETDLLSRSLVKSRVKKYHNTSALMEQLREILMRHAA